eukprot:4356439-Pyramimonas_sp.AAC.1
MNRVPRQLRRVDVQRHILCPRHARSRPSQDRRLANVEHEDHRRVRAFQVDEHAGRQQCSPPRRVGERPVLGGRELAMEMVVSSLSASAHRVERHPVLLATNASQRGQRLHVDDVGRE